MFMRVLMFFLMVGLISSVMLNAMLMAVLGLTAAEGDARVQEKFFSPFCSPFSFSPTAISSWKRTCGPNASSPYFTRPASMR